MGNDISCIRLNYFISVIRMDVGSDNFRFTLDDPEKKARTIRQPTCAELHISSLDRYTSKYGQNQFLTQLSADVTEAPGDYNYSATDCVIQAPGRPMLYGYFNRLAITELQLFVRLPTLINGVNNYFYLGIYPGGVISPGNLTGYIYIIPPGYYTPTLLATAIQTAVRAQAGPLTNASVFTVTGPTNGGNIPGIGAITTGFIFKTNNTDAIFFGSPQAGVDLETQKAIFKFCRLVGTNALSFRGFPSGIPTPTVATFSPNFLPTDYIDIVSKALTNYKDVKDSNSNEQAPQGVIARVYLTDNLVNAAATLTSFTDPNTIGASPFTFTKKWLIPNWCQWSPNQAINQVDFKLLDMWGDTLYWTNEISCANTEWEMTIVASE